MSLIVIALALWIVTHTVAAEIPFTSEAKKPFNCQLCLSGWICLGSAGAAMIRGLPIHSIIWLAIWALSVLIEAVYRRLQTLIL